MQEAAIRSDFRKLARLISAVENGEPGYQEWLQEHHAHHPAPVLGITGPPGAGKSSIVNLLIQAYLDDGDSVAVLAVDPTSPFNFGSLLGDRVRMASHYLNPKVYIRSLGARGSLGGLSAKTLEITDVVQTFSFNRIIVETVGVGQSEVEVAGLADTTVLVLVPEGGDDVQAIKSGIIEVADIFCVNKADREGSDTFISRLKLSLKGMGQEKPVISCSATEGWGIDRLKAAIGTHTTAPDRERKKAQLLAAKARQLLAERRIADFNTKRLVAEIEEQGTANFNVYQWVSEQVFY